MLNAQLQRVPFVVAAFFALPGAPLSAQDRREPPPPPVEVTREDVVARRDQGKPFWETKWSVRDDGALTQWPNPAAGGSTWAGLSFVGDEYPPTDTRDPLVQNLRNRVDNWAEAVAWLAPLLRQHGDLLGATFAERHFAQLGRDASDVALRQFLVQPDVATSDPQRRRELLDRELAVRLLQQRGVGNARGELEAVVKNTGDAFLKRAAQEALAALTGESAPARVALSQLSIAVPASADLWLWIAPTRWPLRADIATAVRSAVAWRLWGQLLAVGRGVHDVILSGAQFFVDAPGELPYEVARVWGRARLDQCLLGFRVAEQGTELAWAAASGAFEVDVLARYLAACKIPHAVRDGVVSSAEWWPTFTVTVARDHVIVRRKAGIDVPAGTWPALVGQAVSAGAALGGELPAGSAMQSVPWLCLNGDSTATVQLSPFVLRSTTKADVVGARERLGIEAASLGRVAGRLPRPELLPEATLAAWQKALPAAAVQPIEGTDRVRIEVVGKDLDPLLLWPLLQVR